MPIPKIQMDTIKKVFKKIFQLFFLLLIGTGASIAWNWDILMEMQRKDSYEFNSILEEGYRFHLIKAYHKFMVLKDLSLEQAYMNRYRRWKKKWVSDAEFRKQFSQEKMELGKVLQKVRAERYDEELEKIYKSQQIIPDQIRGSWDQLAPWQRGLILREKCIHFIELEIKDDRRKMQVKSFSSQEIVSMNRKFLQYTPAEYCEGLVPIGLEEKYVEKALSSLKRGMNYYYFIRLLNEIGLKDSELFTYPSKLERMTEDFNGL